MRERRRRARRAGEPGRLLAGVVAGTWAVQEELRRRSLTVGELVEATGLPLRRTYRLLHAMRAAGLPLDATPRPARAPGEGRAPVAYRLRVRA